MEGWSTAIVVCAEHCVRQLDCLSLVFIIISNEFVTKKYSSWFLFTRLSTSNILTLKKLSKTHTTISNLKQLKKKVVMRFVKLKCSYPSVSGLIYIHFWNEKPRVFLKIWDELMCNTHIFLWQQLKMNKLPLRCCFKYSDEYDLN